MKNFHYGYVIVACQFLVMFVIVGLVMSCAGIFYRPVSQDLEVDVGRFGIYMSLNFLFSTLTLSFAGKVMDKYSARAILATASAVIGLVFVAMSSFNALWQFYGAGIVFGISLAFLLYLGLPTMLNRWFKTKMGLFIGICSAGSGIGGVLFNPIAGYLITQFGWRTTYLIFGLIVLAVVTPVLAIFLRNHPKDKGLLPYGAEGALETTQRAQVETGIDYVRAVKMPIFYALIVFAFLINGAATLNVLLPAYAQSIAFTLEEAAFVASAAMVGVTVGKVGLGAINDKSVAAGIVTTVGLGVVGLLLLIMADAHLSMAVAGGFFFGWAYAGVTVQTPLLVRRVFGQKNYAQIYSVVSMAIAIGGAIAVGGWGLLAAATSFRFIGKTARKHATSVA
ncbi:MAG: MFS transporter [Sutterellaceae bacterium]|nr:MFS transporter [Sutterellaceae bacterium]